MRMDWEVLVIRHRGQAAGSRLMVTAISEFAPDTLVSVVTYRKGDAYGKEARALYQKLGFEPGELLTVYDYPCQRFVLNVPDRVPGIWRN